jgi:SAM-dependent methyltransferase
VERGLTLLEHLDIADGRGLEIGPLVSPTVTRDRANIFYVDHASTDELRAKYKNDPAIDESAITDIDFVWGAQSMLEATKAQAPFDYVIASHVLEHVPDLAGWLSEIESVLRVGGRLSIAVPDRRYTFDVRRRPSDISELVEAALLHLRRPSVRATFDHFYRHTAVDINQMWLGHPVMTIRPSTCRPHWPWRTNPLSTTCTWTRIAGCFLQPSCSSYSATRPS